MVHHRLILQHIIYYLIDTLERDLAKLDEHLLSAIAYYQW